MSAVLPDSYYVDYYSPESSKSTLPSDNAVDPQETLTYETSKYESPYYHDTESEYEPEDDYLNQENTIENIWEHHHNREQTSPYTLSTPSGRRSRITLHYEPGDDFVPLGFDDSEFSIRGNPDSFSEEGNENVKTEPDTTEAASNLSGTTLASIESSRSGSQVLTGSIPSSQAVPSSTSQDIPPPSQDGSQHSINSCYCSCHNHGCPRQRKVLLRQESSPSALMVPFKRKRNFYYPPYSN